MDKVLTALGRTFIGTGLLVFLFVGYQLWGTNFAEARAQDKLADETEQFLDQAPRMKTETTVKVGDPPPPTTKNTTPAPPPAPQGAAVAVIKIPKIGIQKSVVAGTSVDDLKRAPGHYRGTPLPGQPGNAAIAGHRTTYGAPFGDLDKLRKGDLIEVATKQGHFRYRVSAQQIVDPSNVSVLNQSKENKLTLTTCHPKFSAAKRLIVTALLDTSPAPAAEPVSEQATTTTTTTKTIPGETIPTSEASESTVAADPIAARHSLSGEEVPKEPAVLWGIATALVALLIWAVGRAWRRIPAYILGAPIFFVVLFVFFENFSRLLPANA